MPYEKGKFEHRSRQALREDDVKRHGEKMAIYKPRREAWPTASPTAPRRPTRRHPGPRLWPPTLWDDHFCGISHPTCGIFTTALGKLTQGIQKHGFSYGLSKAQRFCVCHSCALKWLYDVVHQNMSCSQGASEDRGTEPGASALARRLSPSPLERFAEPRIKAGARTLRWNPTGCVTLGPHGFAH